MDANNPNPAAYEVLEIPVDLSTHPTFGERVSALQYAREALMVNNNAIFGGNNRADLETAGIDGLLTVASWLINENYEVYKNPASAVLGMRMIEMIQEATSTTNPDGSPKTCGDPECKGCQARYEAWFDAHQAEGDTQNPS